MSDPVVILSYARTPMGSLQGSLSGATATQLGATAVGAAVERAGLSGEAIERIYMGCVLPAGLGQAPARQAALGAGLPQHVEATTVNKMCGSGMQAVMMAADTIAAGSADIIVAGGMESMTNAPYLSQRHRSGARIGHDRLIDHMYMDGLEDAYEPGRLMGSFAEETAVSYGFTREAQDAFAIQSLTRAQAAQASGAFDREIVPVEIAGRKETTTVRLDEQPARGDVAKIPTLKPAFAKDGTITAANASSISDGAAALVLARASVADRLGLTPIARIVAHAGFAHAPARFATAPVFAMRRAMERAGWSAEQIDLFEVNEAFACVTMAAMHDLKLSHERVNVHGGACALGHPIGASGARVLATLLSALETRGAKRGLASLCIGGGEATALALEMIG
ncbi:acetyl-CoA C-acyltransferase [uncultured Sphingomonas sp.]|uniref:acetyl-CoA C-acyltransferase n=1 Tax=uncultured Sphingomonas sp. TaxID=158754 RepID=UPI002600D1C6|nr:acetyl-CoA C-acyltransferase [uncultured Sphingomonas sp.]